MPAEEKSSINHVVANAQAEMVKSIIRGAGKVAKPVIDKVVSDLGIGFKAYLEASYVRCRYFKTILNPSQPLAVLDYYINNNLTCGAKKITDTELIEKLSSLNHVVVTGLAGSGKSMFMKYMTVCRFENPIGYIPLFIELRNLNGLTKINIIEYIRASCTAKGFTVTSDQFKISLSAGAFMVILDGFDELSHEIRDEVAEQILDLSKKYPDTIIVVSSRPDDRFGGWANFHIYNVESLTKAQCLSLIDTLDYDPGVKKRFYKEVNSGLYKSHGSFLSSPLLTTIMLLTYEEFAEIPLKMHSFYSQAFDTLFQKHDAAKEQYKRKSYTGLGKEDFKAVFSAFCAMSYLEEKFSFEDSELLKKCENAINYTYQTKQGIPSNLLAENFVSDLKESVCLLQQDGIETSFVHRSFQEYFAAVFAVSLHGDKIRKVLDRYALRFGDSAIAMSIEMARDSVEQEWVLPTLDELESKIKAGEGNITLSEKLRGIMESINFFIINGETYASFENLDEEFASKLEVIFRVYRNNFTGRRIWSQFDLDRDGLLKRMTDVQNSERLGFDQFVDLMNMKKLRRSTKHDHVTVNFDGDHDWWLSETGLADCLASYESGFAAIKRDIRRRSECRQGILDDFL